jgi:hypothetical protein
MTNLTWPQYPVGSLLKVTENKYVLRVAPSVSHLKPSSKNVFKDSLLQITGHYNQRGYCVGYCLKFRRRPATLADNFYLFLDYVRSGNKPKEMTFPALGGKYDSSICLVKFGALRKNRMYVFIYRRKQDG